MYGFNDNFSIEELLRISAVEGHFELNILLNTCAVNLQSSGQTAWEYKRDKKNLLALLRFVSSADPVSTE